MNRKRFLQLVDFVMWDARSFSTFTMRSTGEHLILYSNNSLGATQVELEYSAEEFYIAVNPQHFKALKLSDSEEFSLAIKNNKLELSHGKAKTRLKIEVLDAQPMSPMIPDTSSLLSAIVTIDDMKSAMERASRVVSKYEAAKYSVTSIYLQARQDSCVLRSTDGTRAYKTEIVANVATDFDFYITASSVNQISKLFALNKSDEVTFLLDKNLYIVADDIVLKVHQPTQKFPKIDQLFDVVREHSLDLSKEDINLIEQATLLSDAGLIKLKLGTTSYVESVSTHVEFTAELSCVSDVDLEMSFCTKATLSLFEEGELHFSIDVKKPLLVKHGVNQLCLARNT